MEFKVGKVSKTKAYTLVELLVVVGILLIAFSVIFVGSNSGDGAKLSSAQRTLSGLVKAARGQAILKNADTRLIIHNDPADVDKYRRFIGIVYYGTDKNSDDGWIASGKGTYLPKGIYFDSTTSDTNSGTAWTTANMNMQINYPRLTVTTSGGSNYFYYEFSDNGTYENPNAYLVFRAGRFIPGSTAPDFPPEKANLKSALIIRQSGTATLVDDPSNI